MGDGMTREVTRHDYLDDNHKLNPTVEAGVVNALARECWETSEAHGFHEDWDAADWLEALADYLDKEERFTTDKTVIMGWDKANSLPDGVPIPHVSTVEGLRQVAQILRTNILGMKLMLTVSELGEALEALRDVGAAGLLQPRDFNVDVKAADNFGEELADAKIRIDDLSGYVKLAIGDAQVAKMAINKDRPHKHGRVV
jgi:hypothetical protein